MTVRINIVWSNDLILFIIAYLSKDKSRAQELELRAHTALAKDQNSVSCMHIQSPTLSVTPALADRTPFYGIHMHLYSRAHT